MKQEKAFTLAEVLITLTIIGVIAALTIPNLMKKWEEQQTVAGVKSALSILSNATRKAIAENGTIDTWPQNGNDFADSFVIVIKNYLKGQRCYVHSNKSIERISKTCYETKDLKDYYYTSLAGTTASGNADYLDDNNGRGLFLLDNGMIAWFRRLSDGGGIWIDINGRKGPNRYGYDVFIFGLNSLTGVIPLTNGPAARLGARGCTQGSTAMATHASGFSCSSWVLKHGNTDYQRRDISSEW